MAGIANIPELPNGPHPEAGLLAVQELVGGSLSIKWPCGFHDSHHTNVQKGLGIGQRPPDPWFVPVAA